ncbi:MAG: gluconokinase [Phormidesmis sp. CAN_BIN44]|nr:gluconokinase [Phormidesmis sp. CAN_BIN44]
MIILVMGVSGSGKTTVGKVLADSLDWEFRDADDFHSLRNVEKMRHGVPLTEADRIPWLHNLQTALKCWLHENRNVVLACSALKNSYRQSLLIDRDRIKLVYLKGSYSLIQKRLQERINHYMPAQLLESQFDALEEPLDALIVGIEQPPQEVMQTIRSTLNI